MKPRGRRALNIFLVQLESDKAELAMPRLYKASRNQPPLHTPTRCQYADLQLILRLKSRQAAAWGLVSPLCGDSPLSVAKGLTNQASLLPAGDSGTGALTFPGSGRLKIIIHGLGRQGKASIQTAVVSPNASHLCKALGDLTKFFLIWDG